MRRTSIQLIEGCFADHDGDGEFGCQERCAPYLVIGPVDARSKVLFTTKPSIFNALGRSALIDKFSMIHRYGLPAPHDPKWIKAIVGPRRLFFIGDADPVDLLIFRWLQLKLGPKKLEYVGVSDRLLAACALTITPLFTIPLSRSERAALTVLEKVFPDYPNALGPNCTQLLGKKRKIEAEALLSFASPSDPIFDCVLNDY